MNKNNTLVVLIAGAVATVAFIVFFTRFPVPCFSRLFTTQSSCASCLPQEMVDSTDSVAVPSITTHEQIDALHQSTTPMVIKFYSDWCPACKVAEQVFPAIAASFKGTVDFYSFDVTQEELVQYAADKGLIPGGSIEVIPTFVFHQQNKVSTLTRGFSGKDTFIQEVKKQFGL